MDLSYALFFPPSVEYLSSLRPYHIPKATTYTFLYAIDPVQLTEAEQNYSKFITDKVTKPDFKIKVTGHIKETDDVTNFPQGQFQLQGERYSAAGSEDSYEDISDESGQNMMEMTLSD